MHLAEFELKCVEVYQTQRFQIEHTIRFIQRPSKSLTALHRNDNTYIIEGLQNAKMRRVNTITHLLTNSTEMYWSCYNLKLSTNPRKKNNSIFRLKNSIMKVKKIKSDIYFFLNCKHEEIYKTTPTTN